jgi:hypothetical protein
VIREVNLLNHLPLYVQEFREIQGIMNAEEPELQSLEDASERIKDNMFILHTDEVGVKRYEDMFGLTPSKNDSLQNRQAMVLSQYTNTVIYTLRGLTERLNLICGVNNYTLKLIPDEYIIEIELYPRIDYLFETIKSMLADMIPANMVWTCVVICNRHRMLAEYPIYLLEQFTHQEMYEKTISDHISNTFENLSNYTMESFESIYCEHIEKYGMRKV